MKKIVQVLSVITLIAVLASCSSGDPLRADIKKMADYQCQLKKLAQAPSGDEKVRKEMETLQKEAEAFVEKMQVKYKAQDTVKAFEEKANKMMAEEMSKCK